MFMVAYLSVRGDFLSRTTTRGGNMSLSTQARAAVSVVVESGGVDKFVLSVASETVFDSDERVNTVMNRFTVECANCGEGVAVGPIINVDDLPRIARFTQNHKC